MKTKLLILLAAFSLVCLNAIAQTPCDRLCGPTTFYVDPAGTNDSNHGTCPLTGAWADPAYAVAWICANVDAAGFQIVIQCAPGLYTKEILLGKVQHAKQGGWPARPLMIEGNADAPWYGPLLSVTNAAAVLAINCAEQWMIEGFQIQSTICCIEADYGSSIYVSKCMFGQYGNPYPSPQKMSAIYGSRIEMVGNCWVNVGGDQIVAALYNSLFIQLGGTALYVQRGSVFTTGEFAVNDPTSWVVGLGVVYF